MASLFVELAAVLVIVFAIAFVMNRIKQPLLIGYIITGVILGPLFFNFISSPESYELFAHIGVALLLFIVGLHLNIKLIKEVGTISLVTGLGQIVFTTLIGLVINRALGMDLLPAAIIAVAITFSSTIIIVKLLGDTHGLHQLHGKISLGFLLVQDFVAVLVLMVLGTTQSTGDIAVTLVIGFTVIAAIILFSRYLLESVLRLVNTHRELLFLFVLAWCLGLSALFGELGFSLEIGALLAGISIASTSFHHEVNSRIKPLQDFFIILFFIFLGTQLIPVPVDPIAGSQLSYALDHLSQISGQAILLSLFVLIGNPLIVFILMTRFRYSARTSFLAGLTVSQISEFSLILVLLAQESGLLTAVDVSLVTLVAIITITSSTYLIVYGKNIYSFLAPFLKQFERPHLRDQRQGMQGERHGILLFGYHRMGHSIRKALERASDTYLVIDHDPNVVRRLKREGVPTLLGDATNAEFISEFDFRDARLIVCTVPEYEANTLLLEYYRLRNPDGTIILTANNARDALEFYSAGADYVIVPQMLSGHYVETMIGELDEDEDRFLTERLKHLHHLKNAPKD